MTFLFSLTKNKIICNHHTLSFLALLPSFFLNINRNFDRSEPWGPSQGQFTSHRVGATSCRGPISGEIPGPWAGGEKPSLDYQHCGEGRAGGQQGHPMRKGGRRPGQPSAPRLSGSSECTSTGPSCTYPQVPWATLFSSEEHPHPCIKERAEQVRLLAKWALGWRLGTWISAGSPDSQN